MTTLFEQTKPATLLNGYTNERQEVTLFTRIIGYFLCCSSLYHANGAQDPPADRFPYGWRTLAEMQPDGSTNYIDIPLTQADFLDPQVGDHLVQSNKHLQFVVSLCNRFSAHYRHAPSVGVFINLKILKHEEVSDALEETAAALAATNRDLVEKRQRAEAAEAEIARLRSLLASQG